MILSGERAEGETGDTFNTTGTAINPSKGAWCFLIAQAVFSRFLVNDDAVGSAIPVQIPCAEELAWRLIDKRLIGCEKYVGSDQGYC
jgi:hypothetical protein